MPTLTIGPQLADALARAALEVQGAPATGRKRMDAEHKLGRVLLAINGAPFGFQGALTPDRPPWPFPETDPIITEARAEFGEPAPDPSAALDAAARLLDRVTRLGGIRGNPWSEGEVRDLCRNLTGEPLGDVRAARPQAFADLFDVVGTDGAKEWREAASLPRANADELAAHKNRVTVEGESYRVECVAPNAT